MSWNVKGSYVETCSCELMCPCNLSMDHGATYDFCRVTLVFDIREGEVDGTDVAGLKVAAIADTPKVMTEGNWRIGLFVDEEPFIPMDRLAGTKSAQFDAKYGRLIELFKAGARLRVQLRFWPEWPTTGTHSVSFSLIGFTKAYGELAACR